MVFMKRWRQFVYSLVFKLILSVSIYYAKARPNLEKKMHPKEKVGGGVREAIVGPATGFVKGKNRNIRQEKTGQEYIDNQFGWLSSRDRASDSQVVNKLDKT